MKYRIMVAIDNKVVKTVFSPIRRQADRIYEKYVEIAKKKGQTLYITMWESGWIVRTEALNYPIKRGVTALSRNI